MTTTPPPRSEAPADNTATGAQPRPPARSEATRLLCAGVYIDAAFRGRVIEELIDNRQRTVAPSLGVDAVPILAHAVRIRRQEVATGLWLALVWLMFFVVDYSLLGLPVMAMVYALVCFLMWFSRGASGRSVAVYTLDGPTSDSSGRRRGRFSVLFRAYVPVVIIAYWVFAIFYMPDEAMFTGLLFPVLLMLPVWWHRVLVDRVLRNELAKERFRRLPRRELPPEYRRLGASIDQEQYARLTVYDPFEPFVGYGRPVEPWSSAVELKRPDSDQPALTSRRVVDLVLPKLEALRRSAAATSRDRLRGLEVEQLTYLPTTPMRGGVGYDRESTDLHISQAVDEGGEARRYFLRVRVGAWDEQVVVSMLVRVHTQGGMLVLEVAPHVLPPVRQEFREIDKLVVRSANSGLRTFIRALVSSPAANLASGISVVRTVASEFRTWLAHPDVLPGEGPVTSVRELGSANRLSLFQQMDISRYVKTVQDRVASGVTDALQASGYETETFTQQIVNISEGGLFIGQMKGGAVAQGERAQATAQQDGSGQV